MQDESLEYAGPGIGTGASLLDTVVLPSIAVTAFWVRFDPKRRGWHHKVAGTVAAWLRPDRSLRP